MLPLTLSDSHPDALPSIQLHQPTFGLRQEHKPMASSSVASGGSFSITSRTFCLALPADIGASLTALSSTVRITESDDERCGRDRPCGERPATLSGRGEHRALRSAWSVKLDARPGRRDFINRPLLYNLIGPHQD
jgi:hypothetical protein